MQEQAAALAEMVSRFKLDANHSAPTAQPVLRKPVTAAAARPAAVKPALKLAKPAMASAAAKPRSQRFALRGVEIEDRRFAAGLDDALDRAFAQTRCAAGDDRNLTFDVQCGDLYNN